MSDSNQSPNNEFAERQQKLKDLQQINELGYKERFERNNSAQSTKTDGVTKELDQILEAPKAEFSLAGRLMLMRPHGKLTFAQLQDKSGRIQICFMQDVLGKDKYKLLKKIDLGDFVGVKGDLFVTKHGETTLLVQDFDLLSKTLRPLPEKFHGLSDRETKYRYRYLDLLSDPETFKRFKFRSHIIKEFRRYLDDHGFDEVETPILTSVASGAVATPFTTHHKALDIPMFLRIAPETYLKRCVIGGFEKVYELGKNFRNEGIDPSHLQEFTMLEYYVAYWNFEDNMDFTEELLKHVIKSSMGTLELIINDREGNPQKIDFGNKWPRHSFVELIKDNCGIDVLDHFGNAGSLRVAISDLGIKIENIENFGYGNLCDALYKKVARPKLIQPCFVIKHPVDTKPLARRNDHEPRLADSFQVLVNSWEIVNAYSELVDPLDQRDRLERQAAAKAAGDEEAMPMDEDYLYAMEHGMPPMSGWGLGIDRFVALLTNQENLKDTVLFPIMKPNRQSEK